MATIDDFQKLDIRVGKVTRTPNFKHPFYTINSEFAEYIHEEISHRSQSEGAGVRQD
jgi:hypothetical protein